jgi:hypothetical protein
MKKIKKEIDIIYEDVICEMSNLRQQTTGLPMIMWISDGKEINHGPRIKLQMDYSTKLNKFNLASVTISDNPRITQGSLSKSDLKIVKDFILLNKDVLLSHWNGENSSEELILGIKKI